MRRLFIIAIFTLISVVVIVVSCSNPHPKYKIGVSQCSEDSWRAKLQEELIMATYFNEDVELRFTSAHDNSKMQERQIDSLIASGIDLLIVSPNQVDNLSEALKRVKDKKIPVVLYDRKTNNNDFTAFMGADNILIGEMLGNYAASLTNAKANIVEIGGLRGSSPAQERHKGFADALRNYPDMHLVAYQSGDWTEQSGEVAMQRLFKDFKGQIDVVYAGNDRMAVGAKRVMKEAGYDVSKVIFLGVDALPTEGGGIELVSDSILTASAIYPTHGDELLQLAIDILDGKKYDKVKFLKSSIVTPSNAKILLLQHEEVIRQAENLRKMHAMASSMHDYIQSQQMFIAMILLLSAVVLMFLILMIRNSRIKHKLNNELKEKNSELQTQHRQLEEANNSLSILNGELQEKNEELLKEKEIAERQRDELEEQRDKIIEMSLSQQLAEGDKEGDGLDGGEKIFRRENEFLRKFVGVIEAHLADSDLSVEDIGSEMCLSRVQLYRKVKALTGKSPVEIIREERLRRGHQLLADSSLTISEIAYRVGFSSPSYFTKCYKDMFGKSPTAVQAV